MTPVIVSKSDSKELGKTITALDTFLDAQDTIVPHTLEGAKKVIAAAQDYWKGVFAAAQAAGKVPKSMSYGEADMHVNRLEEDGSKVSIQEKDDSFEDLLGAFAD